MRPPPISQASLLSICFGATWHDRDHCHLRRSTSSTDSCSVPLFDSDARHHQPPRCTPVMCWVVIRLYISFSHGPPPPTDRMTSSRHGSERVLPQHTPIEAQCSFATQVETANRPMLRVTWRDGGGEESGEVGEGFAALTREEGGHLYGSWEVGVGFVQVWEGRLWMYDSAVVGSEQ